MGNMLLKRLLVFSLLLALMSTAVTAAQDTPVPLRELAEENGIAIGAAVYTIHFGDPNYLETFAREFNMLTPENEAKPCEVQKQLGIFDFTKFDKLVDFAQANDMTIHGHTLLWHQCVPQWLANANFDRDEAIRHLRDHIYTVVGRYKGRVAIWDVVNEAIADSGGVLRDTPWRRLIGDDYIELAFRFAHEADPDALLFYNDYSIEESNKKSDAVYAMLQDFLERDVPIHGVGLQSHHTLGRINGSSIADNIKRIGELGLQVQFTEVDVRYEGDTTPQILERQAKDYATLMDVCLNSEFCTAFITWGVNDKYTWLRSANLGFFENLTVSPLLFDDAYRPKPAYAAVYDSLAAHAAN